MAMPDRLFDSDVVQCPYAHYKSLQGTSPVYRLSGEDDVYLVTRYDDAVDVLSDFHRFSSRTGPGFRQRPVPEAKAVFDSGGHRLVRTLLTNDPPSHTRYRQIVSRAFTARRIAALEPTVKHVVTALASQLGGSGRADFVAAFARPLPLVVIADFLGVPSSDLETFRRWSDDAAEVLGGTLSRERQIEITASLVELLGYFARKSEERRSSPGSDFLSVLLQANDGELTTEEVIAIAYVVLVAGNETTVNLLSSVMLMLLQDRALMDRVRANRSLIPVAIEEALRLEAPVQGAPRVAIADTTIRGVEVPAGSQIMVMLAAANRDPERFDDPDLVRLEESQSRAHISFGKGIHFCVGAALSRLEAEVALNVLFEQFESIELAEQSFVPRYSHNAILRSLVELPVVVG
jgi:cytochrome P450